MKILTETLDYDRSNRLSFEAIVNVISDEKIYNI